MDIICPKCREPWETDTLHDYADEWETTYREVAKAFRTLGCGQAFSEWGVSCHTEKGAEARFAMADLLGDDIDGYAAMCEDFGL